MSIVNDILKKEKEKKKIEKQLIKKMEQEEKELGIEDETPKFTFKDIIDILKKDDALDEELESYLTEEEKIKYHEKLQEEKRYTMLIYKIVGVLAVVLIIFGIILNNITMSPLLKTTEPIIKEYYKEKYNKNISIDNTYYLTYKTEENELKESKIHITKTTDNHHIIGVDNKNIGDDIDTSKVYESYNNTLKSFKFNLIYSSPIISYKDYYKQYNTLYDYIKVLPDGKTYEELIDSKKLTIRDVIFYQGNINVNYFRNFVKKLSDDSKFILIKNEKGLPVNVFIISKKEYFNINITNSLKKDKGITYYEFNRNINGIDDVSITKIKESNIASDNYKYSNAYKISIDKGYYRKDEIKSNYFLIKFDEDKLNTNNIHALSTRKGYGGYYEVLNYDQYPELYFTKVGGSIYVIGNTDSAFANYNNKNKSFLCNLGLC